MRGDRALVDRRRQPAARHGDVIDALRAQRGAYTLETVSPAGERRYERITAIREVLPYDAVDGRPARAWRRAVDAHRLVHRHRSGLLPRCARPARCAATPTSPTTSSARGAARPGQTIYGAISAILRARRHAGGAPVTLLNCDNLRHNGERFRSGLLQFIDAIGDAALARLDRDAARRCPNAMVDRITPRPSPEVRERVKAATGIDDPAALMAESFMQWVIEDDFCNGRPAWDSGRRRDGRIGGAVRGGEDPPAQRDAQLHRVGRHADRARVHPRRHARRGDPPHRLRLRDRRRDSGAAAEPDRSAPPTATSCSTASATPRSATPTSASRWTASRRFPASSRRRCASGSRAASRSRASRCCRRSFSRSCSAGIAARIPYRYEDQGMDPDAAHAICDAADPTAAFAADRGLWGPLAGDTPPRRRAAPRRRACRHFHRRSTSMKPRSRAGTRC